MGCGSSKSTEKQFFDELSNLDKEVSNLRTSQKELSGLMNNVPNAGDRDENFGSFQEELSSRLEKLEGMISEIQQLRLSQKLFKSYQVKHKTDENLKVQLAEVAASEPENSFKAKNDRLVMIDRSIIEDPSIKAMIEKKREKLEKKQLNRA